MNDPQAIAVGAALSALSGDSQTNRLLRLDFPCQDGPDAILLVNRLVADEEISRSFRFKVEVLSDDARIPLKVMMARMVTISLVRANGSLRYFNGYVTQFAAVRTDGGFAFYEMILEPWLAFARLRKDSVSFHGKSVRAITEATLQHYRQADWHMHIHETDPVLSVANQHNETDYNHLHRRWETLGLHYWYEHRANGHTLILSDMSMLAQPIDATRHDDADVIAFRAKNGACESDGIRDWSPVRQLGSGTTNLVTFDYKNPTAQRVSYQSINAQGDFFAYERYENMGAYGFRIRTEGETLAQKRMVALDKVTQYFDAAGNDRAVQPGRFFKLGGHFSAAPRSKRHDPVPRASIGNRQYLIVTAHHEASNNYQAGAGAPSHYANTFTCIRNAVRWRPGRDYHSEPCANPGLQTAMVVGPAGQEIHTDSLGRVKLQFHWDRLGSYDENSSPWVRVMVPAAGGEFGQIRLPRIGEEVAVVYPDGNIDHPLILGALYNGRNKPPWALPEQAPLSGLRSRELGGGARGNHLILDDTKGKIQAQLKSDHLCSQLSLGHIARIEDTAGRKDERGEGFELRTDGHGVARAAKGMLITTEGRDTADGAIKEMGETTHHLRHAAEQHNSIAKIAQENGAQDAEFSQSGIATLLMALTQETEGAASGTDCFPELAKPHLIIAGTSSLATSTVGDTHITSNRHIAVTTGKDLSIATGASLFASIRQALRIFVQNAGIRLIAAAGDIQVKALSDGIKLLAKLEISHEANRITLNAKQEIVINGGGSYAKFSADGIEIGTNGKFIAHASHHSLEGPARMNLELHDVSVTAGNDILDEKTWVEFNLMDGENPVPGEFYELTDPDGQVHQGKLDIEGRGRVDKVPYGKCKLVFPRVGYKTDIKQR